MIDVTPAIRIDEAEIEERFIRAPGSGGQKVNKTETAVQLRFDARSSPGIPTAVFLRLKRLAGQRMTKDGVIVISANRFRTQALNRTDAMDRLLDLIRAAEPAPKRRRPVKPSKGAKRRRLESKRRQGALKKMRGRISDD